MLVTGIKKDRYGRLVAKVIAAGRDVSLAQIEAGLAWHYKRYLREQSAEDAMAYTQAEQRAQLECAGLWQDLSSIPPWAWRKQALSPAASAAAALTQPTSSALNPR